MKTYKVAILGATGAVGQEMIKILMERSFPIRELHLLASARSLPLPIRSISLRKRQKTASMAWISF